MPKIWMRSKRPSTSAARLACGWKSCISSAIFRPHRAMSMIFLKAIEDARREGIDVTLDRYPSPGWGAKHYTVLVPGSIAQSPPVLEVELVFPSAMNTSRIPGGRNEVCGCGNTQGIDARPDRRLAQKMRSPEKSTLKGPFPKSATARDVPHQKCGPGFACLPDPPSTIMYTVDENRWRRSCRSPTYLPPAAAVLCRWAQALASIPAYTERSRERSEST